MPPCPMVAALPLHGGDLAAAARRFGSPSDGWLDLSTGINPHAYPLPAISPEAWRRLPGAEAEIGLQMAAARAYGVADPARVVVAAGGQALIQILPRIRRRGRVRVVWPTYGEHAASWEAAGHQVELGGWAGAGEAADVVVVVNPNNPDGICRARDELLAVAEALGPRDGLLVVDEAFADVTPEISLSNVIHPNLVVLRSFGKFFGLAGLRLGFAIAGSKTAEKLRAAVGLWAVNGPAMAVATVALNDAGWIAGMRARLAREAETLDAMLSRASCTVVGGTSLFRLVRTPEAPAVYDRLGHAGILVRAFTYEPDWLRIGLPADASGRLRLARALASG